MLCFHFGVNLLCDLKMTLLYTEVIQVCSPRLPGARLQGACGSSLQGMGTAAPQPQRGVEAASCRESSLPTVSGSSSITQPVWFPWASREGGLVLTLLQVPTSGPDPSRRL